MTCHRSRLIAYRTLFLGLYLFGARSSASAESFPPDSTTSPHLDMVTLEALLLRASSPDWADRLAMIAVNPRDAEHRRPHLAGPSRPPAYYRDVILPDPPTGRVLVDQVVREETMEQQMPVRTTPSAHPHPTYQRWHVAANYVVPFPSGR